MDTGSAILLVVSALLVVSMLYLLVSSVSRRGSGRSVPEAPPVPDRTLRDGANSAPAAEGTPAVPGEVRSLPRAESVPHVTTGSLDPPESEPSTTATVSAPEPSPPRPADPAPMPPLAETPEVPEYTMVAPVELSFSDGSHRVGIPAGSANFLKYQRLAAVLRDDLKRARQR
jgi:hypothetical protein